MADGCALAPECTMSVQAAIASWPPKPDSHHPQDDRLANLCGHLSSLSAKLDRLVDALGIIAPAMGSLPALVGALGEQLAANKSVAATADSCEAAMHGDAAKKPGDASYSFARAVYWNSCMFLQAPGAFKPLVVLKSLVSGVDAEKAYAA